jgi:hypothetical protein
LVEQACRVFLLGGPDLARQNSRTGQGADDGVADGDPHAAPQRRDLREAVAGALSPIDRGPTALLVAT